MPRKLPGHCPCYNISMLIDTHCHLHDREWFSAEQAEEFLQKAHASGVEKIICIGTDPEDSKNAKNFAASHENVYWTYGIHPEFANSYVDDGVVLPPFEVMGLKSLAEYQPPVAIGEIGLDYHYEGYDRNTQIRLFEQMLQLARDHNLPVSLHIREAFADAFPVLDNFPELRGVIHSFTGNKRELKQALDRGFYIGVNGYVTYATPPIPPLNCILLETDAPFLTPIPLRGTINTPEYVKYVAAYLSEKLGVAEETIVEQTTNHARKLFKI